MIGRTVSHYRIIGTLGRGGMGVVYEAEDLHLGRRVAIKFSTSGESPVYRARFLREARAASLLNHPNIAGVYDYGETPEGDPFIVMELVRGEELYQVLRKGPLPLWQSLRIVSAVAEALAAAHRQGIVHRDIKPSNIVVGERGLVKVLDFGLAKKMERVVRAQDESTVATDATLQGVVLGTPSYMSPEQTREAPLAAPSDLFSLGCVLYECLAGRPPFVGANTIEILAAVLHVEPAPPSQFNPAVPPELDRIVLKSLSKAAGERYQTAEELLADLRPAMSPLDPTAETEVLPSGSGSHATAARPASRTISVPAQFTRRNAIGAAAVLVFVGAIAWWLWFGRTYKAPPDAQRWYDEGVAALRDGTYYKASKALERAAHIDPKFALAHARLAEAWLELDYADRAKEEMLRAEPPGATLRLTSADQTYLEALHLTLTGDFAGAAAKYRALASSAGSGERANAYVDLGRSYEKNEKPLDALAAYQQATKLEPQNPAAWLRLAVLYGRRRDPAKANSSFQEAEALYRSHSNLEGVAEVLYQRAIVAGQTGQGAAARGLLQQALEMARNTGNISQEIVVTQQSSSVDLRAGKTQEAEQEATRAIDLAHANGLEGLAARGLIDLGNAYFIRGDFGSAEARFQQALEYARRYHAQRSEARAQLSLGSLELQRGRPEGLAKVQAARAWYERGGYQRETAQALILIAREQRQRGDLPAALASFQQELEIARRMGDPAQIGNSQQGIGTVLEAQEQWPEALSHFREALATAKQASDGLNAPYYALDVVRMLCRLGRLDEARSGLDQVDTIPAAIATQAEFLRAAIAVEQRKFAEAIDNAKKVLARPGLNSAFAAAAHSALGLAQSATGARAAALESTAQAAKLAGTYGSTVLVIEPLLARAQVLLASGDKKGAVEAVLAAQPEFARANRSEPAWRVWLVAAQASAPADARQYAEKAEISLAALQKKWDAESYQNYLNRPDVQWERGQLSRLSLAK